MAAWSWSVLTGSTNTSGAIARFLNKSTLTSGPGGDADLILSEATSWIFARLRHWQMLTAPALAVMATGAGSDQIALPTGMLEPDQIWIAGVPAGSSSFFQQILTQTLPQRLYQLWNFNGSGTRVPQTPIAYSFNESFIQLDSPPDLPYPYYTTYYKQPDDLSNSNQTNFLTAHYQRLLRVTTMMIGAEWAKESNQGQYDRTYWLQQAEDEIQNVQAQSDRARRAAVVAPVYSGGGYDNIGGYTPVGWPQ